MNDFQFFDADVSVKLRGLQTLMAQHLLDKTNVRAVVEHGGGHRVPEYVATPGGDSSGPRDMPVNKIPQTIEIEAVALVVHQQQR